MLSERKQNGNITKDREINGESSEWKQQKDRQKDKDLRLGLNEATDHWAMAIGVWTCANEG